MKKTLIISLVVFFCLSFPHFSLFAQNEQITITTYYPSPFGSYRQLTWGNFPNTRGVLAPDANAGSAIELGGLNAAGGPGIPYIDFSNDMASDFDARIILTGDDVLSIQGAGLDFLLNIDAAPTVDPLSGLAPYNAAPPRFRNRSDTP